MTYTDNNATTRVSDEVIESMLPFFSEKYGNPASMYYFALESKHPIDDARKQVAEFLNAESPDEIVFTSCGTESNNLAIFGSLAAISDRKHIITTAVEHPAVLNLYKKLEKEGYFIKILPVDNKGLINLDDLRAALSDQTALVSIMWANNETGVIMPIEEACSISHEKGALFHTDAVQAAGKIPVDVQKTKVDLLSISGHKIHAPKGVGALYIKSGTRIKPLLIGGHHENGKRAGTLNVPGIVGLGKACELASEFLNDENTRVKSLRDKLESEILRIIPKTHINGDLENRTPNTTNITFEFIEGEAMLLSMSEFGICASSGSACTSGSLEPSHVLLAMGVPMSLAHSAVRFSLGRYNTEKDIDYIIEKLPGIIERLRKMSPFGEGI